MSELEQDLGLLGADGAPLVKPPAGAPEPEPEKAQRPRAWVVVCKGLGLINMVAVSAEELVERLHSAREEAELMQQELLVAFAVLDNTAEGEEAVIWFNPALVQAVINEYKPPVAPARHAPLRGLRDIAVVQVDADDGGEGE